MALTELQQVLRQRLVAMGVSKAELLYIGAAMYTEEMQMELAHWMVEHENASPEELCSVASKIYSEKEKQEE